MSAHEEPPTHPWIKTPSAAVAGGVAHCGPWERDGHRSIQVNVDGRGCNIVGDAANEPSIAVDPTDPRKIVIGWRQFDSVASDFRQAGYAYSHNDGYKWVFPGSLTPGVFGSDPVLAADADGTIFYLSINFDEMRLFRSADGGASWQPRVRVRSGFWDKPWMAIDQTAGPGRGHIYISAEGQFLRSTDGGTTFTASSEVPYWATLSVGPEGEVYAYSFGMTKSVDAQYSAASPTFTEYTYVPLCPDGRQALRAKRSYEVVAGIPTSPNPGGLIGQDWVATDHSQTSRRGNVYALGVARCSDLDPLDIMFNSSSDGGLTWNTPVRVNDDPVANGAWQWFGAMSVAPNGRIDVFWNDTRNSRRANLSELFYSFSIDGGQTWSPNVPVSPMFDSWVGWPIQPKIGDYYHVVSDDLGAKVAYAATFNGEQDIYYLRIGPWDCNGNEIDDVADIAGGFSLDCNANAAPDECESDCNGNGIPDDCDIASTLSVDLNSNGVPDECQRILRVNARAVVFGNGSGWEAPLRDLQDAIRLATSAPGTVPEIWVAAGAYLPTSAGGDRKARFRMRSNVALYGGFGGWESERSQRDPINHPTILSGDLNGDDGPDFSGYAENSLHVVDASAADSTAILDGFIIKGGNADDYHDQYAPDTKGGGLFIENGSPTIRHCQFDRESVRGVWRRALCARWSTGYKGLPFSAQRGIRVLWRWRWSVVSEVA